MKTKDKNNSEVLTLQDGRQSSCITHLISVAHAHMAFRLHHLNSVF